MSLTREILTPEIKKTIAEHLGTEVDQVDMNKHLSEIGADSLDLIELVMEFEEIYRIELSDEVCSNIETGTDLVNAVCNELKL